jgi:peroxiredoxin
MMDETLRKRRTLPQSDIKSDEDMEINQLAPDFELPDLDGRIHRLSVHRGKIVIVNFWSCECPHSERTDQSMLAMFDHWCEKVVMLWIASNRNESNQALKKVAEARRISTVLLDMDCSAADLFEAQTTPHVFVIDREGILCYRGAVDDVTFHQRTPTRFFLNEAVDSLLKGQFPELTESPAYGCTIVREV